MCRSKSQTTVLAAPPAKAVAVEAHLQAEFSLHSEPGRTCPLSYQYSPAVFQTQVARHCETLYVAGGLYGNSLALSTIESLVAEEPQAQVVFNGDYHWFDIQPDWFADIDQRVRAFTRLRGNVETELFNKTDELGCGCAYPANVADSIVERSNQIQKKLKLAVSSQFSADAAFLPMTLTYEVGQTNVGVVHGDAQSLAGWQFDPSELDQTANRSKLAQLFKSSGMHVFASSHTCTPGIRVFEKFGAVINNGSSGMANLPGTTHGIMTRISMHPAPKTLPVLYSQTYAGVFLQAIKVEFNLVQWQRQFLQAWPAHSPAHESYFDRISRGPTSTVNYCARIE
jgi:hypothetical protein